MFFSVSSGLEGVTLVEMDFSYELRDIRVVENQPFSLGWSTNIKPIQAWWFDQWLAILGLMVGRKDRWVTNS